MLHILALFTIAKTFFTRENVLLKFCLCDRTLWFLHIRIFHAECVFPFHCATFPLFFYVNMLDRCVWPLLSCLLQCLARGTLFKLKFPFKKNVSRTCGGFLPFHCMRLMVFKTKTHSVWIPHTHYPSTLWVLSPKWTKTTCLSHMCFFLRRPTWWIWTRILWCQSVWYIILKMESPGE